MSAGFELELSPSILLPLVQNTNKVAHISNESEKARNVEAVSQGAAPETQTRGISSGAEENFSKETNSKTGG